MAFTADDLNTVNAAIATGELSVTFADGKQVRYRSVAELERARQMIIGDLDNAEAGDRRPARAVTIHVRKGLR